MYIAANVRYNEQAFPCSDDQNFISLASSGPKESSETLERFYVLTFSCSTDEASIVTYHNPSEDTHSAKNDDTSATEPNNAEPTEPQQENNTEPVNSDNEPSPYQSKQTQTLTP